MMIPAVVLALTLGLLWFLLRRQKPDPARQEAELLRHIQKLVLKNGNRFAIIRNWRTALEAAPTKEHDGRRVALAALAYFEELLARISELSSAFRHCDTQQRPFLLAEIQGIAQALAGIADTIATPLAFSGVKLDGVRNLRAEQTSPPQ